MHRAGLKIIIVITVLASLCLSRPDGDPPLQPTPGTGMFLMLSDLHFDPFGDSNVMRDLGADPKAGCGGLDSKSFSPYGSDTNYPLLKSTLENAALTAARNHFQYGYVIMAGDFLAHDFDTTYRKCVGTDPEAYRKFVADTIAYVDRMIAKTLPGVPVFAALGNNDSDRGDYAAPSAYFLATVGRDWSRRWGNLPAGVRANALASFGRAGNYAVRQPTVPNSEFIVLNSTLWAAHNAGACGDADPDPGGQFAWLGGVLLRLKQSGGSAIIIFHILPGIDAMKASLGAPQSLWTDACTAKLISEVSEFRGVVREIYAGHIHRDDFRLLPDRDGRPLLPIHVIPAVSPVYLNNPAVEIGWYDQRTGELRDYAPLYLDLKHPPSVWALEYVFTRAYGYPQPDLAALVELSRKLHDGNPQSGPGQQFANAYAAGVGWLLPPGQWPVYTCAQTETNLPQYRLCTQAEARHRLDTHLP